MVNPDHPATPPWTDKFSSGANVEPLKPTVFQTDKLRATWRAWVEAETSGWSSFIFVTLNFKPHVLGDDGRVIRLSEAIARKSVRWFGNRIDRKIHGNKVQRFNTRVRRVPFLEHGSDRGWHCHIVMEKPSGMADIRFRGAVQEVWTDNEWCAGLPDVRTADSQLAGYLTKFRSKFEMEDWSDTIILEAVVADAKYPTLPT